MAYKLAVDRKVFDAFPGYQAAIVYASDLANGPSTDRTMAWLRDAERGARSQFDRDLFKDDPQIRAWYDAFVKFGVKKGKYRPRLRHCSSGSCPAMTCRPSTPWSTPTTRSSSITSFPSAQDRDRLASDLELRFMSGAETFDTVNSGEPVLDASMPARWRVRRRRRDLPALELAAMPAHRAQRSDPQCVFLTRSPAALPRATAPGGGAGTRASRILQLSPSAKVTLTNCFAPSRNEAAQDAAEDCQCEDISKCRMSERWRCWDCVDYRALRKQFFGAIIDDGYLVIPTLRISRWCRGCFRRAICA